jgi:hypothetical protein
VCCGKVRPQHHWYQWQLQKLWQESWRQMEFLVQCAVSVLVAATLGRPWPVTPDFLSCPSPEVLRLDTRSACSMCNYITSHHIYIPSLDPKLVKMTIECEICHINTKKKVCTVQLKFSHKRPQENSGCKYDYLKIHTHIRCVAINNGFAHPLPGNLVGVRSE